MDREERNYYLKEELIDFCREANLQTTGGKIEITERIAYYLRTGSKLRTARSKSSSGSNVLGHTYIALDTCIESNFKCSEQHRTFFKNQIGKTFTFNVEFQKWLKENAGKTYRDAIDAYLEIKGKKRNNRTKIDRQFEYNTYIRDFFDDNKDKQLKEAIVCWKYKKSLPGSNKYEQKDLEILKKQYENICNQK